MRIFLILLLLSTLLFGTKILNTDVQKEQNDVTVTLAFDTPYEGVISKGYQDNYLIIRLSDLTIERSFVKDDISSLINSLTVQSQNGETMIIAEALKGVKLSALKSKDGYTVRIYFSKPIGANASVEKTTTSYFGTTDYLLMLLLAIGGGALIFWLLRKKDQLFPPPINPKEMLQKVTNEPVEVPKTDHDNKNIRNIEEDQPRQKKEVNIEIRFEEMIDDDNRALLLVYNDREYPVVLGEENYFLNKHGSTDAPLSEEVFKALVDNHMKSMQDKKKAASDKQESCSRDEPLESYKEKASRDTLF